jgi:hypothetical protein
MKVLKKYGAFITALGCLIYLVTSWGDNWILTWILLAGLIICPLIGISDLKEHKSQKQ